MARLREHHQAAVAVQVDEPGRDHMPRDIDAAGGVEVRRGAIRPDAQPLPHDTDRTREAGRTGSVHDRAALEQQVDRVRHGVVGGAWLIRQAYRGDGTGSTVHDKVHGRRKGCLTATVSCRQNAARQGSGRGGA